MMKNLPEGTSIGEMRASLQWILSHTARFAGLVLVTIQGSHGFILINMGKPLLYYFRHGTTVLKGHTAYEYFRSQPFIQFELRKYTVLEMTLALSIASAGEGNPGATTPGKRSDGMPVENAVSRESSSGETSSGEGEIPSTQSSGEDGNSVYEMDPTGYSEFAKETVSYAGLSQDAIVSPEGGPDPSLFPYISPGGIDEPQEPQKTDIGELILGQILNLPGVLAVTIFRRGLNVLSIGNINTENLVNVAEDLIESAKGLSFVMRTGPFIQVTLQIPAGNILIAPYYSEYVCILTSPGINLGQIRKIIRELPGVEPEEEAGDMV